MSEPKPAARKDDLIEHNQSQVLRFLGMVFANAWAAARVASVAKNIVLASAGPAGWAALGVSIVVEWAVVEAVEWASGEIGERIRTQGIHGIRNGSPAVFINLRNAARGGPTGDPLACHSGKIVREGSRWVSFDGKPAGRLGDFTNHSGKVSSGSPNVYIGGPPVSYDNELAVHGLVGNLFSLRSLGAAAIAGEFASEAAKETGIQVLDQLWGMRN